MSSGKSYVSVSTIQLAYAAALRQSTHCVSSPSGRKTCSSPSPAQAISSLAGGGGGGAGSGVTGHFWIRRWRRKPTAERTPVSGGSARSACRRSPSGKPPSSHFTASTASPRASRTPSNRSRREWRSDSSSLSACASWEEG
ncbi:hypothetical protein ASD97_05610 [Streptomyces sp. Root63]|nr:hypothetical protein ASD29_27535 [Streptomyces sp. Root1295]KRA49911.1 hypothetical protein ASD97_05610 [Streptomyces sp. Root63]